MTAVVAARSAFDEVLLSRPHRFAASLMRIHLLGAGKYTERLHMSWSRGLCSRIFRRFGSPVFDSSLLFPSSIDGW